MNKYKVLTGLEPGSVISTTLDMGKSSHLFDSLVREGRTIFTFREPDRTLVNIPYAGVETIAGAEERHHGGRIRIGNGLRKLARR